MFETVRDYLAQQLEVDPALITPDTDIIDDLEADSLDLVELIMTLEDHYDIEYSCTAAKKLQKGASPGARMPTADTGRQGWPQRCAA